MIAREQLSPPTSPSESSPSLPRGERRPQDGRLQGRVAIVTGAGRGIGRQIALTFAREGACVLIATRTGSHGANVVDDIRAAGGVADFFEVSVRSAGAVKAIVARAIELWERLDIVVHNSGSVASGLLTELSDDALQEAFDTTVNSAFWFIKHAAPRMPSNGQGRFIFTSSIAPERSQRCYVSYGAMKGGLNALVRGAAHELGPMGITVNAVAPGGTHSASFDANVRADFVAALARMTPLGRVGEGRDIANAMLFLASDEASYVTGQVLVVDGGQSLGALQVL